MKHGFIRTKALERRGCTYKFMYLYEYSVEEQQAVRYSRKARSNATLTKVKNLNDKRSRVNFEWRLMNNFTGSDYSAVLTFENNVTEKEAKRILENFYKRLRRFYKKHNVELKRITVQEYGKRGGRLHYHLIVNSGGRIRQTDIIDLWGNIGHCYIEKLNFTNDEDILALCHYLEKQQKQCPKNKCSWSCSKNLTRPEATIDDNAVSRKTMRRLQEAARNDELVQCIEQIYNGWRIVGDPVVGVNEVTGRLFASFRLKRNKNSSRVSRSTLCLNGGSVSGSVASRLQKTVPKTVPLM